MIGASYDTPEENKAFAQENDFPYPLLSDPDKAVAEKYGVKRPDDHEYAAFPRRLTFLIDPQGNIAKSYAVKDIAAHVDEVVSDLTSLISAR